MLSTTADGRSEWSVSTGMQVSNDWWTYQLQCPQSRFGFLHAVQGAEASCAHNVVVIQMPCGGVQIGVGADSSPLRQPGGLKARVLHRCHSQLAALAAAHPAAIWQVLEEKMASRTVQAIQASLGGYTNHPPCGLMSALLKHQCWAAGHVCSSSAQHVEPPITAGSPSPGEVLAPSGQQSDGGGASGLSATPASQPTTLSQAHAAPLLTQQQQQPRQSMPPTAGLAEAAGSIQAGAGTGTQTAQQQQQPWQSEFEAEAGPELGSSSVSRRRAAHRALRRQNARRWREGVDFTTTRSSGEERASTDEALRFRHAGDRPFTGLTELPLQMRPLTIRQVCLLLIISAERGLTHSVNQPGWH